MSCEKLGKHTQATGIMEPYPRYNLELYAYLLTSGLRHRTMVHIYKYNLIIYLYIYIYLLALNQGLLLTLFNIMFSIFTAKGHTFGENQCRTAMCKSLDRIKGQFPFYKTGILIIALPYSVTERLK